MRKKNSKINVTQNYLYTKIDVILIDNWYPLGFRSSSATFRWFGFGFRFWFSMCSWFRTAAATATTARTTATPDTIKKL